MIKIECKENLNISFIDGSLVLTIENSKKSEIGIIPEDLVSEDNYKFDSIRPRITAKQKREIKELKNQGYSRKEAAENISLSYHQVARYWNK
tara:strand:+ start:918 stop:1193 length:276 start_codon:yes stop_codon:yes gene_type:complete